MPGGGAMARENVEVVLFQAARLKSKTRLARGGSCIAGAGFEPATFGL